MPYVPPDRRLYIDPISIRTQRARPRAQTPGELNYQITRLILDYMNVHSLSYQTINDIVGALEGVKAEFQRRVVAPYEDQKIQENGDVY